MRKSSKTTARSGNVRKSDSFREAWKRINEAKEQKFFLEAVTIQESIICDRLIAYLHRNHGFPAKTKNDKHHRLSDLVRALQKHEPNRVRRNGKPMADEIKRWADQRNRVVHSIVRSDPGLPTAPVEEFLALAAEAAAAGEALAREVERMRPPAPRKQPLTSTGE